MIPKVLMRYPGAKTRIAKHILPHIGKPERYCELFAGAGAVLIQMLGAHVPKEIWINDFDIGVWQIWDSIHRYPSDLCRDLETLVPSVESFAALDPNQPAERIALHQWSYSGLGPGAGPIGGRDQSGAWKIDCRWDVEFGGSPPVD